MTSADNTDPSAPALNSQLRAAQLGEILLILMVFFAVGGDPARHVNEAHYLSWLKHFWNPTWCASDFFLSTPESHVTFAWTLGWVTRWLPLSASAWIGRCVAWFAIAWAWRRLSWRV